MTPEKEKALKDDKERWSDGETNLYLLRKKYNKTQQDNTQDEYHYETYNYSGEDKTKQFEQ